MKKPVIYKASNDIDMAPLIDVVFLLLMFFMLTSTFQRQESIKLELPEAKMSSEQPQTMTVSVRLDGTLFFEGISMSLSELGKRIHQHMSKDTARGVTLHADAGVAVQRLVQVMDELQQNGIVNIALATQKIGQN